MTEERAHPSSPDSGEIDVTTDEPLDPKAARRARRATAKLALRIPDDEVARPQEPARDARIIPESGDPEDTLEVKTIGNGEASSPTLVEADLPTEISQPIQPSRIISVGPPPPDPPAEKKLEEQRTQEHIPSSPSTQPIDGLPEDPDSRKTHLDADDEVPTPIAGRVAPVPLVAADEDDIDVPVDEDVPQYRPRVPTLPSNPPPPPPAGTRARQTSDDALEIDDVEAAAVLSQRAPQRPVSLPAVPPAPRVPMISTKPPLPSTPTPAPVPAAAPPAPAPAPVSAAAPAPPAPISPPIPADALSSAPQLGEDERPKPRPIATALIDDEEVSGLDELGSDAPPAAPPALDSSDEIDTSDVLAVAPAAPKAVTKEGRPISAPPVPPHQAKTPPPVQIPLVVPAAATPSSASPLAPPPLQDAPRRRARPWWEELFNDDFIRTMPKLTEPQIAAEVSFIEDSLGVERGGSLLDLGCGTGQIAVRLSQRGYTVVGLDLSVAMLARAGEEAQDHNQKINFVQGDMREMTFEDAFDGIYCWGSTFGFFEEEKNAHVIQRVHKALRHGGQFLLDVVSRDFVIAQAPSLAWFEGEGCVCMDEMAVDWITSRMRVKRTMMFDDGRSKETEYSIRVYSLHELGKLLHDAGFRVAEVSGRIHTPGVFFGPNSPRTLILAEKR